MSLQRVTRTSLGWTASEVLRLIAGGQLLHAPAIAGGERWRERLGGLAVPTLVVHGTDDPVLPHDHGRVLAREIRGAELLTPEQTGHELPRRVWDAVIPAILEHTSGA